MLQLLLILPVLGVSTDLVCDRSEPLFNCTTVPPLSVFFLDTTTYLTSTQVQMEFAYVAENIVGKIGVFNPGFVPYQRQAYGTFGYGLVSSTADVVNSTEACWDLNALLNAYQNGSFPLLKVIEYMNKSYDFHKFFIFTASTDDNDIDDAAAFVTTNMTNPYITMIALEGASARLEAHSNAWQVYRIPDLTNPPPEVAYCISKRTCYYKSPCDPAGSTTSHPSPTAMPTPSPQPSVASLGLVCDRSEPLFNCTSTYVPETSVFWIDTSSYLTPSQVQTEIDYVARNIVGNIGVFNPYFNPYQKELYAAFGVGGSSSVWRYAPNSSVACSELDNMLGAYQKYGSDLGTLTRLLEVYIDEIYPAPLFVFTASTDDNDIDNAAAFVINNMTDPFITMIALEGASATLEAHSNAWTVYRIPDLTNPPPGVAYCIAKKTCMDTSPCDATTAQPSTTLQTTTTIPAQNSTPIVTTVQPNVSSGTGHGCSKCDYSKVWTDVMYVVDASENTGTTNLGEIWGLVQSMSPWFNVQDAYYTASNYSMRVGIVSYASSATLLSPLGQTTEEKIDNMDMNVVHGDRGTNLAAALQLASAQFNTAAHRPNARKVIVVLATTYKSGNYDSPENAASSFTDANGIIIVYEDVKDTASHSPLLQSLASPGYLISSLNSTMQTVQQAMCDANCFCPAQFTSFSKNARQNPTGGCYRAVTVPANSNVAKHTCQQKFNNGFVASDSSVAMTNFLQDLFGTPTNFYIGLVFDSFSNQWVWMDGTPLTGSYQPWYNGYRPSSASNGGCVYVAQGTQQWVQTDCRNGYLYTCESNPCDSTHYCPLSQD